MIILTIRTDKPESEIGLYDDSRQLAYEAWEANRKLAETLHYKIKALLATQNYDFTDLAGIIVFEGPGSFTGLRIGISVANALSYGLRVSIVGEQGDNWIENGTSRLILAENDLPITPFYGAEANITKPRK